MPDAVSTETNDDLHAELSAEWDKLSAADEAPQSTEQAPASAETPTETAKAAADRARDEHGRFVKKAAEAATEPVQTPETQAAAQTLPTEQAQPQAAQTRPIGPPPGWSVAAKAEFDKLSPAIKEAIAKREEEVSNGFAKLQSFKGLEPYAEHAARAGTTLPQVMERFFAAEQLLATDFVSGIQSLCQHFNVNPAALVAALGGQGQGYQQPHAQPQVRDNRVDALERRLAQYEQERAMEAQNGISAEIQAFAAKPENKYFENVRRSMSILLSNEQAYDDDEVHDLKWAYDRACWAHPEIRQLLINEQAEARAQEAQRKASEARRASGSLNPGSPLPNGSNSGPNRNLSVRDELLANWDAHAI